MVYSFNHYTQVHELPYRSSSTAICWILFLIRSPDVFIMMLSRSRKSSWLKTSPSSSGPITCEEKSKKCEMEFGGDSNLRRSPRSGRLNSPVHY